MDAAKADVRLVEPSQSVRQRVHKGNISHASDIRIRVMCFDRDFVVGNRIRRLHEKPTETFCSVFRSV